MLEKRDELRGLSAADLKRIPEQSQQEYGAQIELLDIEGLKKAEEELMEKFKENDEYIKNVRYQLPRNTEMKVTDGAGNEIVIKETAKTIKSYIIDFLNTIESDWTTSLGIYQLILFWEKNGDGKIPYYVLDSVLRTLGSVVKYKGKENLQKIALVNNYFSSIHSTYMEDTTYMYYLSGIHQMILKKMDDINNDNGQGLDNQVSDNQA